MFQARNDWRSPKERLFSLQTAGVVLAALMVLAYPIYTVLGQALTHGIHRKGDLLVVDMKAMSNFDFDQVVGTTADIPKVYRDLDGKRVMMAGEIVYPDTASGNLHGFQLVYSIQHCCFNGPPLVQHFVFATVEPGCKVNFIGGVVNVTGTLHVGAEQAGGRVVSVYKLDVEKVE